MEYAMWKARRWARRRMWRVLNALRVEMVRFHCRPERVNRVTRLCGKLAGKGAAA